MFRRPVAVCPSHHKCYALADGVCSWLFHLSSQVGVWFKHDARILRWFRGHRSNLVVLWSGRLPIVFLPSRVTLRPFCLWHTRDKRLYWRGKRRDRGTNGDADPKVDSSPEDGLYLCRFPSHWRQLGHITNKRGRTFRLITV